jgi:DNA-binding beta-propeller fold protein YncE
LSRDTIAEEHGVHDPHVPASASVLDHEISFPRFSASVVAAVVAVVAAFLLRLPGLDRWPLSVAEANLAHTAHDIVRGTGDVDRLFGAATTVNWAALFFFVGWPSDSVARISVAAAGILAVISVLLLRQTLGTAQAVWGSLLIATSPTLIATSRRLDGGALFVLLTLVVVACALMTSRSPSLAWRAAAGSATALLVMAGSLGFPAALLAWLGALLLIGRVPSPRLDSMIAGLAAALGTTVLISTVFVTRPVAFSASSGELLSQFWHIHLSQIGRLGWLPAFNLILNEPIILALALVAVLGSPYRPLVRALAIWFVAAFAMMTLLGDVSVSGYSLVVLPLALLAGAGAAHLIERLPWRDFQHGSAVIYVFAILLMAAAAVSLLGLLTGGTGDGTVDWLMRFSLVVIVGVLPLSIVISWVGQRLPGNRLVLVLFAGLMLLSVVTVRSAILAASERPGMPGDPLADRATSASIPIVISRLQRVSRDLTMGQRSSQDPGGGHGLVVAIDERIHQPFAWYFRDFPNAVVFDPDVEAMPVNADVALLDGSRDARLVAPGYTGEAYPLAATRPEVLQSPDWGDLITGIVNPNQWRDFTGYLINRQPQAAAAQREFQVFATGDVAERMFAALGPFDLDDRAGAGSAPGQLNRPRGIDVAPDGSIYVIDSRNARVNVYAPDGSFQRSFGSEGAGPGQLARLTTAGGGGASDVAIDESGNVFVADTWNHRIQVFASDGTYLYGWGEFYDARDDPEATTQRPGAFYGPRGLALRDGLLYVTDTGNERVQIFQLDGQFVDMFGLPGAGDGMLLEPVGIAVSAEGVIYVADSHNARIARFSADAEWLDPIPVQDWAGQQFFEPYLTVADDGRVFATTSVLGSIVEIDPQTMAISQRSVAELRQPFGIAIAPNGVELLVTDGTVQAVIRVPLQGR